MSLVQIPTDSLARKGFRSGAHCYSGFGIGEILGVIISVGLFAMGDPRDEDAAAHAHCH